MKDSERGVPRPKSPLSPPWKDTNETINEIIQIFKDDSKKLKPIKIAIRYKIHGLIPREAIVQIPKDSYCTEDTIYDACHDEIEEMIGQVPKWIRVLGKVEITPISYE